ncbi:16S rRNA (guanine1207-N2)-methyltransferase [Salinihabitans flavidus]|uniref:16S rRNA (Guanine1207-N2)-methyltransferase n=1 Tax=Salinihabitans flavidus TaxID=569882 RepID=A0A1H8V5U3_9RHOB|nr:methyltransferase [Salinihabitans flavidus]SEP10850.1 16S rRNA (guanine1207-N2)-methyltransferase [Salinihabitans flavidus]
MSEPRLSLALKDGTLHLPDTGRIAVIGPRADQDLSALPQGRVQVITPIKPDFDVFFDAGYDCAVSADGGGPYAVALVCLPRVKVLAHARIAQAAALAPLVIVDGQKTDGADSLLRDCRKRAEVGGVLSKAHGKLFWFQGGDFADWAAPGPARGAHGYVTAPGVFSADGPDPASVALAAALPAKLGRKVADLGAGWGFLSAAVLERSGVEILHLVEADHTALECARQNVTDARARFHWADATRWRPEERLDTVVMNPPFHSGRSADPELGRAFIAAAAQMLTPSGALWLVANRHLPYEAALRAAFERVEEVAGDTRFKILHGERPSRPAR